MQLQFTNKEIYFATSQCFRELHPRFQTHLADLVLANDDETYSQTVTITTQQLVQIYKSQSSLPEGVARAINGQMRDNLLAQLLPLTEQGNTEAIEALGLIQEISVKNDAATQAIIDNGKAQILA
jgi:hypothetical protein